MKDLWVYVLIALACSQAGFIYGYGRALDHPTMPVMEALK